MFLQLPFLKHKLNIGGWGFFSYGFRMSFFRIQVWEPSISMVCNGSNGCSHVIPCPFRMIWIDMLENGAKSWKWRQILDFFLFEKLSVSGVSWIRWIPISACHRHILMGGKCPHQKEEQTSHPSCWRNISSCCTDAHWMLNIYPFILDEFRSSR